MQVRAKHILEISSETLKNPSFFELWARARRKQARRKQLTSSEARLEEQLLVQQGVVTEQHSDLSALLYGFI